MQPPASAAAAECPWRLCPLAFPGGTGHWRWSGAGCKLFFCFGWRGRGAGMSCSPSGGPAPGAEDPAAGAWG
eukprot:gene20774-biopygen2605